MRYLLPTIAVLWALPLAAMAQSPSCQTIANPTDRLACYDRASPPIRADKPAPSGAATLSKASTAGKTPQNVPLADMLEVENNQLAARIGSICRGC
jgi:hypothetical protein